MTELFFHASFDAPEKCIRRTPPHMRPSSRHLDVAIARGCCTEVEYRCDEGESLEAGQGCTHLESFLNAQVASEAHTLLTLALSMLNF